MPLIEDLAYTQTTLTRYILTTCMILGIIGSLFNFTVFCQKKFKSNSCSAYFIATSIFNLLVILCGITPELLIYFRNYDLTSSSSTFCKAKSYFVHIFLMMSRSSVALACIDRYALCSRNVHIRRLNQRHIAISLLIIICITWIIVPIHIIFYVDIQMPLRYCTGSGIYLVIYSIYAAIVTIIPLIIMIIFSILAIQNLRVTNAHLYLSRVNSNASNTKGKSRSIRMQKRDVQMITILISEVIVYYISTVWYPMYSIYIAITFDTPKTLNRVAIDGFLRYLALNFFVFLNSCSTFYVNLLASKAFRFECKQLILHCYKRNQNNGQWSVFSDISNTGKQLIRLRNRS